MSDNYFGNKRGQPSKKAKALPKDVSEYAAKKARSLIAAEFERGGLNAHALQYQKSDFLTNPLIAFARYIDRTE